MKVLAFTAVLIVGFGIATYELTKGPKPQPFGLTSSELSWAVGYNVWRSRVRAELTTAYLTGRYATRLEQVARTIEPLADCSRSYSADVGAAPSGILAVATKARHACVYASSAVRQFRNDR